MQPAPKLEDFAHGRVPRAVREAQILSLAEALFAERGYDNASMDELAQRAGISKPMIYGLVGNKEALFRRCFERSGDELDARLKAAVAEGAGDLAGEIRATARAFYEFIEQSSFAWAMLFSLDTGGRSEASVSAIRRRQAQSTAAQIVRRAGETGIELDPLRVDAAAWLLNSGYETLAHWRLEHPATSTEQLVQWLVEFIVPGLQALLR